MMLAKRQNLGLINCSSCQFGIESNCTLPEVQQKQCKSIPEKCYVNKQNPKPECLACFYQGDNEAECLRCFPILGNVEPGCEGWSPSVNPTSSSNSIYPQETGTAPSSQPNGPSPTQSFPSKDSAGPKTGSPNVQNAEPAQDGSKGLGSGAVAGVAIGCLLAGAAVAALVLLLLFRRHRKRQTLYNGTPGQLVAHHVGPLHQEKGVGAAAGAAALKDGVTVTATDLPQPAEDDAITGQMSMLRDKIKNHAQSYYHVMPVDPVTVSEAPLGGFARGTGLAPATIKEFLCNPQSRQAMIRSYLSWETLSRCGAQGDSDASLLPAEVASFVSSFSAQVAPDSRKWKKKPPPASPLLPRAQRVQLLTPESRRSLPIQPLESGVRGPPAEAVSAAGGQADGAAGTHRRGCGGRQRGSSPVRERSRRCGTAGPEPREPVRARRRLRVPAVRAAERVAVRLAGVREGRSAWGLGRVAGAATGRR